MKKVIFCIRGGGVKAGSSVGAMKVLEENKIEISEFSGTSIGGIVAALAAIGTPTTEILDLLKQWVVIFSESNRLAEGKGSSIIEEAMNKQCEYRKFKDVETPLYIAANCGGLWNTKPFIFNKWNSPDVTLGEACRASSSFPICYERYNLVVNGKRMRFWDGGMAMNPFLPDAGYGEKVRICSSFRKNKVNYMSRYKWAWMAPENNAEITLLPYVGKMGSFGTPQDIELAYIAGYNETQKRIGEILEKIYDEPKSWDDIIPNI